MKNPLISSITPDSLRAWADGSIAVVAHDAGAAGHLFSWLQPLDMQLKFCVSGPARKIIEKQRPKSHNFLNLYECVEGSKLLISGTGWSSNIEYESRKIASELGIPSIAVLDHWVNYKERFKRDEKIILANALWVADSEALEIASKEFTGLPIRLLTNNWLEQLIESVRKQRERRNCLQPIKPAISLLYLLEPLRDRKTGRPNGEEFKALDYWINNLSTLITQGYVTKNIDNLVLRIRPHPSEPIKKYGDWVKRHQSRWNIIIDKSETLEQSLAIADLAFGCETQALIAAMLCNIPAFSTLPPEAPKCRLPHKNIKILNNLLA